MPPGEKIAFEPTLALMFAQHLHDLAAATQKFVIVGGGGEPLASGHFEHRFETIGQRLVGPENSEIALRGVQLEHVAQESTQHMGVPDTPDSRFEYVHRVVGKIRHPQIAQEHSAVGIGIRAHTSFADGRQRGQFRFEAALLVE